MPNETQETVETTETTVTETPATVETADAAANGEGDTVSISKSELDAIKKALKAANSEAAERRKKIEEIETQKQQAEAAQLAEQGKFKELFEKAEAARIEAENKAAKVERERMIDRIAAEQGLPEMIRDRLQGETEEELKADALKLAELIPAKPTAPDMGATNRGAATPGVMDDEREAYIRRKFKLGATPTPLA